MTVTANMHDEILNEREAAAYLRLSVRTLQNARVSGLGPVYLRLGLRRIGFLKADLIAFANQRRFASTSAEDAAQRAGSHPARKG